jgi:hypothetical protein
VVLSFSTRHWKLIVDLRSTNAIEQDASGNVVFTGGLPGEDAFAHPAPASVADAFLKLREAVRDIAVTLAVPQGTVEWNPTAPGLVEFWRDGKKEVFSLFPEERAKLQSLSENLRRAVDQANPYLEV